jgi:hypothetical protein
MLSEALQRNAKPGKRGGSRHPKDGLYAAKHEARRFQTSLTIVLVAAEKEVV